MLHRAEMYRGRLSENRRHGRLRKPGRHCRVTEHQVGRADNFGRGNQMQAGGRGVAWGEADM